MSKKKKIEIDLNTCKPGDVLVSVHGHAFIYSHKEPDHAFPHKIKDALNDEPGSRIDNGQVFAKNRMPEDHDIVKIIHVNQI